MPVVLEPNFHAVGNAFTGEAFLAPGELGLGDGQRGDAAAVILCRVAGHAAPAGPDFEQVVGGLEAEIAAERVILRGLGLLQRELGRDEEAAGVSHRGVEPETVEVVPEVVMLGDVAAADLHRIGAEQVLHAVRAAQEIERERAAPGAGHAGGVLDVFDEPRYDRRQIIRVPIAVHVSLAETDVTEEHTALEEAGAQDTEPCGGLRSVAKAADGAVGQGGFEAAQRHFGERFLNGTLVETGACGSLGGRVPGGRAKVRVGAHAGEWMVARSSRSATERR